MPKAPWSRLSWSEVMKDPYAADGPAPGVGVAHRARGTLVLTSSARIESERNSDGVVIPPASVKSQAAMVMLLSSLVLRTDTCATNCSSLPGAISLAALLASSLDRKLARESSVGWSYKTVGERSILNLVPSALINSTADRESKPADISGAFMSTFVPTISSATAWTVLWASS